MRDDGKGGHRGLRANWPFVALLLCFSPPGGAANFKFESFPLAVSIEGKPVRSSLYIQFESKRYEMTLEQFAAQKLDDRERLFLRGIRSIRAKDYEAFRAFFEPPQASKAGAAVQVKLTAENYVDLYSNAYGNLESLKIVSQVLLGSSSLFTWEAPLKTGQVLSEGFLVRMNPGKPTLTPVSSSTPLAAVILNMLLASTTNAAAYEPASNLHLRYRYPLALEGKNEPGQHPVFLLFDGAPLNFDAMDPKAPAPNKALAFYRDAFVAFKQRATDDFLKAFTPESQPRVKSWLAAISKDTSQTFYESIASGRYVKFLLNADPVYLVFYSGDKTDKWIPNTLDYDYVVRDPKSGTYRLANFLFGTDLDRVLKDHDSFDQRILKPARPAPSQPGVNLAPGKAPADGKRPPKQP